MGQLNQQRQKDSRQQVESLFATAAPRNVVRCRCHSPIHPSCVRPSLHFQSPSSPLHPPSFHSIPPCIPPSPALPSPPLPCPHKHQAEPPRWPSRRAGRRQSESEKKERKKEMGEEGRRGGLEAEGRGTSTLQSSSSTSSSLWSFSSSSIT